MLANFLEDFILKKKREYFLYNLVLYVKNIFLPRKGIPDVAKNLGSLVRSLETSAASLEECSDSIIKLSKSAQSDSDTILAAIKGFKDVTNENHVYTYTPWESRCNNEYFFFYAFRD